MTPEELQAVWADQPRMEVDVTPGLRRQQQIDFAVPTSKFRGDGPRKVHVPLLTVGAVFVVAVGAVGLAKFMSVSPVSLSPAGGEGRGEGKQALAECRTWARPESGHPDFARAEEACRRADQLAPNGEAEKLLLEVARLKVCDDELTLARQAGAAGKIEDSIIWLSAIREDCGSSFTRAQLYANEVLPRAIAKLKARCETNGTDACAQYLDLACQRGSLAGDPIFERTRGANWSCPNVPALREVVPKRSSAESDRVALSNRYATTELATASLLYFDGAYEQAIAALEKERTPRAREFLEDVKRARRLMLDSLGVLQRDGDVGLAAKMIDDLLGLDSKWMRGPDDVVLITSDLRRAAIRGISDGAYERGLRQIDRLDDRGACASWKIGAKFTREHLNLLKALMAVCTNKASVAVDNAKTCEDYDGALDFAVDRDGYKEEIEALKRAKGCP